MNLNVLLLNDYFIFHQLQLEEALLRTSQDNWLILNQGSSPAIVMGISGIVDELINRSKALSLSLPIIKRFSGGGTVVVDHHTLFFTLIMNKQDVSCSPYPKPIMQWIETSIKKAFPAEFCLMENDFAIGNKKCGGNAQYIQKDRWLHHTTFLWDYCPQNMKSLLLPKKQPDYRKSRSHEEFLIPLKGYFPHMTDCSHQLLQQFSAYHINYYHLESALIHLNNPHRTSTIQVNYADIGSNQLE
ncbi:MAG: lipoate--protein ligase family protein [Chlamydiales bacterium]|nr:lipoate--protein ligase family protein [Chlamydiales bacterium]